ncbi:MAG TPA: hypothetical protein VMI33_20600 [Streptosporangiaceae bacterium]|nr:hypothetical protein [Streptosporangiaceae bacterium]
MVSWLALVAAFVIVAGLCAILMARLARIGPPAPPGPLAPGPLAPGPLAPGPPP